MHSALAGDGVVFRFRQQLAPLIRSRGEVLRPLVKEGIDPEFVGLANFGMMFAVAMQRWLDTSQDDPATTAAQFNRLSTGGFTRDKTRTQNAGPYSDPQ